MDEKRDQKPGITALDGEQASIVSTTVVQLANINTIGLEAIEPLQPGSEKCSCSSITAKEDGSRNEWTNIDNDSSEHKQFEDELRASEKKLHDAFNSLLAMAESLVLSPSENEHGAYTTPTANEVAVRLAGLTRSLLECHGVGIFTLEPQTDALVPMAIVGLSPEQEQQWWTAPLQQGNKLDARFTPAMVAQLQSNEVLLLDMQQPEYRDLYNPYATRFILVAPMTLGEQLIGLLILDYGNTEHQYTPQEVAFAKAVAKLVTLVIERKRLLYERAEAQANELAQREANRRMEEFLGIASHELRTPLTTINVHIQMVARLLKRLLEQEDLDIKELTSKSAAMQDMLSSAAHQVEVLNRLVNDLIDISRIHANKLALHIRPEPCDLARIVWETVHNQRYTTPEREIHLKMAYPETAFLQDMTNKGRLLVPVLADADRIGQVVSNYLTNALKYSPADRPIEVRLRVSRGQARFSVTDQGPGLSPEEQERIWERFYQVEGHAAQNSGGAGLGLGLHISRSIIERHQGEVGIQSNLGKGSTFWFTLPLVRYRYRRAKEG
ncbi:MAG TPA: HAMP domain-containing sensor histidine kinase [Ktedonobacteraceae bacterium]|nr:HAMP domain-containing sensor histidine kinase [Ktedonobacteraceae bacterium]